MDDDSPKPEERMGIPQFEEPKNAEKNTNNTA